MNTYIREREVFSFSLKRPLAAPVGRAHAHRHRLPYWHHLPPHQRPLQPQLRRRRRCMRRRQRLPVEHVIRRCRRCACGLHERRRVLHGVVERRGAGGGCGG